MEKNDLKTPLSIAYYRRRSFSKGKKGKKNVLVRNIYFYGTDIGEHYNNDVNG